MCCTIFSPSTPSDGITVEVVDVGGGEEEDFNRVDVEGKIAVIRSRPEGPPKFWMGRYAQRAAERGALGLILIHHMPWPYRTSMEVGLHDISKRFPEKPLPAVCISSVDGQELMYLLGKGGLKVNLKLRVSVEDKETYVVSGFHEGKVKPLERVAIIAHRDHGIPPGANDNGSGMGTMLEIARVLSKYKPRRTIEFISSTAEEGVTAGAWAYVQAHKDEMPNIKAVFNLDMFGVGGRINLVGLGVWPDKPEVNHSEWLNKLLESIADELGYGFGRMVAGWGVSESGRFIDEGVPAVWFWRADDPYYHTVHDSPDKIDINSLKAVGDVVAIAVWRLANARKIRIEEA